MKLRSFRIVGFRSIVDSGDCPLSGPITALVGLNGSGKSSVLEALKGFQFNHGHGFEDNTVPLFQAVESKDRRLELVFVLTKSDIKRIEEHFGEKLPRELVKPWTSEGMRVTTYQGSFSISESHRLPNPHASAIEEQSVEFRDIVKAVNRELGTTTPELLPEDIEWEEFASIRDQVLAEGRTLGNGALQRWGKELSRLYSAIRLQRPQVMLADLLAKIGPQFVHISGRELLASATESKNMTKLAGRAIAAVGQQIENVGALPLPQRRRLLRDASRRYTNALRNVLGEEEVSVAVELDDKEGFIGLDRGDVWLSPGQLSAGTETLLSTLVQLFEQQRDAVILLDEPDTSLHIDAQRRLYKLLRDQGKVHTILLATHSPFMVPIEAPFSIRVVERVNNVTQIEINPHHTKSPDALAPVFRAIGFSGDAWAGGFGRRNVLVEGVVDSTYLHALSDVVGSPLDGLSIIPLTGATRSLHLAPVFEAWKIEYIALVDRDEEGKRVYDAFETEQRTDRIAFIVDEKNGQVEDLISPSDFDRLALAHGSIKRRDGESNSALIKRAKLNKKLLALSFSNSLRSATITIDENTRTNFENLRNRLLAMMGKKTQ